MKRIGNLYDYIISVENLNEAERKARKAKGAQPGVRIFDRNREENIARLHDVLARCEYHTSPYATFTIFEPKERQICRLPYYPDRIVHHAIMNVMESVWVPMFTADTYSCIKKRGIDFVGYRFWHTHTLMRKCVKKNLCRAVAKLHKKGIEDITQMRVALCGWIGWAKYCNSIHLINKLKIQAVCS